MSKKDIVASITSYFPNEDRFFSSTIWLPATVEQINNAKQTARANVPGADVSVSIYDCSFLPRIEYAVLAPTTVEELNYLVVRLNTLNETEDAVYRALFEMRIREQGDTALSVKDLINMTYGLDDVIMMPGINNDEDLGYMVIANDLHPDIEAIPAASRYLLDPKTIGRLHRQQEDGVIMNGIYVETSSYRMEEVYDGKHIPEAENAGVIRIKAGFVNSDVPSSDEDHAVTIILPADKEAVDALVNSVFNVPHIESCDLLDIESSIPQISVNAIKGLNDFDMLNTISAKYQLLSAADQIKYKAILSAEGVHDVYRAFHKLDELESYELSYMDGDEGSFFKSYLLHQLPDTFDRHWLDTLITSSEGIKLMNRLGATLTEYGVLSPKYGHLFHLVPTSLFNPPEGPEMKGHSPTDEPSEIKENQNMDNNQNNAESYTISLIDTDALRTMDGMEGLVLQGCGGNLAEWIVGINDELTSAGILLNGTKFKECSSFEHDGVTCLLFPFTDDVNLDVGKLAIWRLQTHEHYYGTWLSDYVPNQLGGFIKSEEPVQRYKPDCPLIGQDSNVFNLIGIAARTLRENGMKDEASELTHRAMSAGSFDQALGIITEYVNVTSVDEDEGMDESEEVDEYESEDMSDFSGEDDVHEGMDLDL